MKNNLYKTIFLVAAFLVTLNTIAQDRNVVWVEGLGEEEDFWEHYDNIFEGEREINTLRKNFYSTNISSGANHVISSMGTFYGSSGAINSQNIGIGHSMGGLMVRQVDYSSTGSNFGGLITVATPNYGAPIANAINDGSATNTVTDACDKIHAGPIAELFGPLWQIINGLTTNEICGLFLSNDIVQGWVGSPAAINDLEVGSDAIGYINNYSTTIPQISIWAEENSPVHWRLFSTKIPGSTTQFISKINSARSVYNAFRANNIALGIANTLFNPFAAANYYYKASQWKKGRDWIDDSETIWSSLIKTTRIETETYWQETWVPCPYPPGIPTVANPGGNNTTAPKSVDPNCGEWLWIELTRNITVNYPSDGLLPQYTQELEDVVSGNRYHVSGANHIEVGDMSNSTQGDLTEDRFNEIFDRSAPDFFRTDKRIP